MTTGTLPNPNKREQDKQQVSDHVLRRILIWPALLYMVIVTQVPLLFTLRFSFERWNMNRPDRRAFTGLDNYVDVITDSSF